MYNMNNLFTTKLLKKGFDNYFTEEHTLPQ